MKRSIKRGLYSIGIALLISAPISRLATESWDNSPPSIFEPISEPLSGVQEPVRENEDMTAELVRAELERQAAIDRREAIEADARRVLEEYQVEVPEDVQIYCEKAQEESNVCAELLEAICWRESTFSPTAENGGCLGIMQISTKWHEDRMARLGVTDIYDAEGNIRVGADYLKELFAKWDGDTYRVLMEYNGDTSEGISDYAKEICEVSAALERIHGK